METKEIAMSIELTEQQRQALKEEEPPRVIDPATKECYVLVRAEVYERMRQLLGEDFGPREAYPAIDQAFAAGWNDPRMDAYDRYEEERDRQQR
jgi:predicted ATPase